MAPSHNGEGEWSPARWRDKEPAASSNQIKYPPPPDAKEAQPGFARLCIEEASCHHAHPGPEYTPLRGVRGLYGGRWMPGSKPARQL